MMVMSHLNLLLSLEKRIGVLSGSTLPLLLAASLEFPDQLVTATTAVAIRHLASRWRYLLGAPGAL